MDQLQKIREMERLTGQKEQLQEAELQSYLQRQQSVREAQKNSQGGAVSPETQQDQAICQRLANMMMEDIEADRNLADLLPEAHAQKEKDLEKLRKEANRSGKDKLKNDFTGKHRRAAKARLEQINQKREEIAQTRHGRNAYIPAERRERERGRHRWNPLRAFMNSFSLGSKADRHGMAEYENVPGTVKANLEITTENGVLRGQVYRPKNVQQRNQKLVIVFSGSGGGGGVMISSIVPAYTNEGATVLHAAYRGFGGSETRENGKKVGTHLCEDSIYQDGRATYDYAVNVLGYKPSDIILHGYSLGGAVASKVAADIAEENAFRLGEGENVEEPQRLGGLVLHSSIATTKEAGAYFMGNAAGAIASAGSGTYDTRSYMRRLHRLDPNLPVHYRGGKIEKREVTNEKGKKEVRKVVEDHLCLDVTKLDQDAQARFTNASSFNGDQDHITQVYDEDKNDWVTTSALNMNAGLDSIKEMVRNGRNAHLS